MANERLINRPVKTNPNTSDVLYVADMSNSGNEVQSTIGQLITTNNVVTQSGSITSGDIPVINTSGVIVDSGVNVDHSQNITNVNSITLNTPPATSSQAATKGYVDSQLSGNLKIVNNLNDVSSASASRANLGLGTAATKTASSNVLTNVSSVSGNPTVGNLAVWADSNGTIVDGGPVPAPGPSGRVRTITGTTVLTSADFGSTIVCKGISMNYNVTMPVGTVTNGFLDFVFDTGTLSGITVSLILQAGDSWSSMDNINTLVFGAGEGISVMCDGSHTYIIYDSNSASCFVQAVRLQPFVVSANTPTTVVFEVSNGLNNLAMVNGVYAIYYQGWYQLSCTIMNPSNSVAYTTSLNLINNSVLQYYTTQFVPANTAQPITLNVISKFFVGDAVSIQYETTQSVDIANYQATTLNLNRLPNYPFHE